MKTNQTFNLKRFCNYSISTLRMRYKQLLLMLAVAATGIFIFAFVPLLDHSTWHIDSWIGLAVSSTLIGGLLYVGSAFPPLRKREKTLAFLMIPASTFEKILYEFSERIVAFLIIFPVILYSFSNMAVALAVQIKNHLYVGGVRFEKFSILKLIEMNNAGNNWSMFSGLFAGLILAFAGSIIFRKYPLVKLIVSVMAIFILIGAYSYFLIEKMKLTHPWIEILVNKTDHEVPVLPMIIPLLFIGLSALAFAYFKLKEKEVS